MHDDSLRQAVGKLISQEGFSEDFALTLLKGGRNNRVYKVHAEDRHAILKEYFKHPSDPRDRGATEFSFLSYAWQQGIDCVPRPIQYDQDLSLALYEFIEGEQLSEEDVSPAFVQQAVDFFKSLNAHRHLKQAAELRPASEACFSVEKHIECTERRVQTLLAATEEHPNDRSFTTMEPEAREFIRNRLVPTWQRVRDDMLRDCDIFKLSQVENISFENRRLSPSDFGFHNALARKGSGRLCFIDFEYAGWDDVAKTVCDFFLQPSVPVPSKYVTIFLDGVLDGFADRDLEENRIRTLWPLHQVKWCCIILNDYLPLGDERRRFSLGEEAHSQRRKEQLQLASQTLCRVGSAFGFQVCEAL